MISQGAVKDFGQVCSSVFRSVAQCQRSVGSGCCSVFPRVVSSVEQCGVEFPREPWEDRMPGAACAPAQPLLCTHTLFLKPMIVCALPQYFEKPFIRLPLCLVQRFSMREAFETRVL